MLAVVVLAGGLGTRMRPLTETMPKALIPVLGRPFAELQLEWLADQGVTHVVYSIGYRGDMVRAALGDGARYGVRLVFVDEGADLRGSLGALRLAFDENALPSEFFVLYGDSYLNVDLHLLEQAWRQAHAQALMTVLRNDGRWDRSNVAFADGRVLYDKHGTATPSQSLRWIDYGLSVMRRASIAAALPPQGRGDLAELLHSMSVRGDVAGFEVSQRFFEVGSPQGLADLEAHLRARTGRKAAI